jgi:hypothetical protein
MKIIPMPPSLCLLATLLLFALSLPFSALAVEPTNSTEASAQKAAAEKKAAAQKTLSEKFAVWKVSLPPERPQDPADRLRAAAGQSGQPL